jgi:hypothetical protein
MSGVGFLDGRTRNQKRHVWRDGRWVLRLTHYQQIPFDSDDRQHQHFNRMGIVWIGIDPVAVSSRLHLSGNPAATLPKHRATSRLHKGPPSVARSLSGQQATKRAGRDQQ